MIVLLDNSHGGLIGGEYQTSGKRSPVWDDGSQLFEGEFNRAIVNGIVERLTRDGIGLIVYALSAYPLLNILLGHTYPAMPLFGTAPCPTTIFTFAMLILARSRVPGCLLIIPFLWAGIGLSAALQLGMWEDLGLVLAGLPGAILVIRSNRRRDYE